MIGIKMCKFNPKNDSRTIDPCMKNLIDFMNLNEIETLACCCGHGKYPMTIVVNWEELKFEIVSNTEIPRKKKFYKKDRHGFYYIPEVSEQSEGNK